MFNLTPWSNGPVPGAFYNFPGTNHAENKSLGSFGSQRSAGPITTGTSVIAIKCKDGVIMAADTLISYGSLARYHNVDRVFKINEHTILGAGGDYADFQFLKRHIDQKITEDIAFGDNNQMKPKSLYNWLTRVLYNKRSRMEPLWVDIVVGGIQDGEPFLGHIDIRGRAYEANVIATGYGQHLAIPLLREYSENPNAHLNLEKSVELTKKCMEVLYYRDCRGSPNYKQAICTKTGAEVQGPFTVEQNWELANLIKGYN